MEKYVMHLKKLSKRRRNLLMAGILAALLPLSIFSIMREQDVRQRAAESEKPNIIVIMTDDQRADSLDTMEIMKTRVRSKGITFTNGYVTTSLCCPSRASFFSGMYAHNTGVWANEGPNGGWNTFRKHESQSIAVWMKQAGYKTALIGKYINEYNNGSHVPPGWDKWYVTIGGQDYHNYQISDNGKSRPGQGYSTDTYKTQAVEFIKNTQGPIFLMLALNAPHGPAAPAQRHRGLCNKIQLVTKGDPAFQRNQLCTLKAVDETVGAILDTLGPRAENTVLIYYADNGYSYGEHGITKKKLFI